MCVCRGDVPACSCEKGLERDAGTGSMTERKRNNVWIGRHMDSLYNPRLRSIIKGK